jgi:hypothetical protein
MPDGDRFERKLFGRGWRKAYRLAHGGAADSLVADALITATAHGLRNGLACPNLGVICDTVYQALITAARNNELNFHGSDRVDPFYQLSIELEEIRSSGSASVATQLAINAAQTTYLDLEERSQSISQLELRSRFSQRFVELLIRNQWLDRVRDGIVEKRGWSSDSQMAWEQKLISILADPACKLMKSALKASVKEKIRAPRRLTPKMKMTIDELNQGLMVLE